MSKKAFFFALISLLLFPSLLAAAEKSSPNSSASVANRRTAIRYMQLAKQYASDKQWAEADSNAKIGLAYDDSIADLWYLRAVMNMNMGEKKSEILPLVIKALSNGEWVDYNKDGSRILYADILCTTHQYEKALAVLDEKPFIYSSDAEYIRAKIYYNLKTPENLEKARLKIDAARRVYPTDTRFAELFYQFEYMLYRKSGTINEQTQKLSDAFLASLANYKKAEPELELYAAIFVKDTARRERLLKAFNAKGNRSALYPAVALQAGLMEEQTAIDYFYTFADNSISLSVLEDFVSELKKEESKKELAEYLNSYNGTIFIDTDEDLLFNMTVNFNRGRAEHIFYDDNQDDEFEWTAECDFGVPVKLYLSENHLDILYGSWPYVLNAVYKNKENGIPLTFNLIAETLKWSPFTIEANKSVYDATGVELFLPVVLHGSKVNVSGAELINAALGYTMPSAEKKGALIEVSLLNGLSQHATYSVDEKIYALAKFENGLPVMRTVDVDGDGLFETTEEYGYSKDMKLKFISKADEMQIITNLFGSAASNTGIYVKSIKIDRNGDTIPDFTEEYTAGEGKIASWDVDFDGKWDVRYVKHPSMVDGKLREEAMFYEPLKNNVVTVSSEDGVPVGVQNGDEFFQVSKGINKNFYWIDKIGTKQVEEKIKNELSKTADQGMCIIVEDRTDRYLAVRVEKKIFAEKLPAEAVKNDVKK